MHRRPRVTFTRSAFRCACIALLAASLPAAAFDYSYKGFATAQAGDIVSGDHDQYLNYSCPCYVANWEYADVYQDKGWMASPESLIGVQGNAQLYGPLSATTQLVARGSTEKLTADWAYLAYAIGHNWTIQAGRERLPLYSDTATIGYSYPWARPPPEVYGWEIYDYDGGRVIWKTGAGDWSFNTDVYAGRRATGDNRMDELLYYDFPVYEAWNHIYGVSFEAINDYVDFRVLYQHSKVDTFGHPAPDTTVPIDLHAGQPFVDANLSVDYDHFLLRAEAQSLSRPSEAYYAFAYYLSGGYRLGQVTGMLTHGWYYERNTGGSPDNLLVGDPQPGRFDTSSVSLRWDFMKSWDAKLQFDLFHDSSAFQFIGDSRLVTVGVDTVF